MVRATYIIPAKSYSTLQGYTHEAVHVVDGLYTSTMTFAFALIVSIQHNVTTRVAAAAAMLASFAATYPPHYAFNTPQC